jgi:hypothetical protein
MNDNMPLWIYRLLQMLAWRDAALGNAREIKRLREWFKFLVGRIESKHVYIAKLQQMLIGKVTECNTVAAERDHYQAAIRQMLSGQLIRTDSAEHIYLMRNDYVYRNAYERTFSPSNLRKYFK